MNEHPSSDQGTVRFLVLDLRFDVFRCRWHLVRPLFVVKPNDDLLLGDTSLSANGRSRCCWPPESVDVGSYENEDDRCVEHDNHLQRGKGWFLASFTKEDVTLNSDFFK